MSDKDSIMTFGARAHEGLIFGRSKTLNASSFFGSSCKSAGSGKMVVPLLRKDMRFITSSHIERPFVGWTQKICDGSIQTKWTGSGKSNTRMLTS